MLRKVFLPILAIFILMAHAASSASAENRFMLDREDFWSCDHFSNNLWGLHDTLKEKYGLSFDMIYLQDFFWNTRGGLNTRDSGEYPRLFGLYLELDTAKAGLWENGTFFLGLEHHSGRSPSERQVGDFQVISNIDAKRFNHVSELWYRHSFLDSTLWLKLGKMEATSDFSHIETGLEFLNSSAGLIPTIPMPSYPDQDWGAVAGVEPADWFSCNFGIYQGKIDGGRSPGNTLDNLRGPMLIAEPSLKYKLGDMPGSLNIGAWWNGRDFEAFQKHPSSRDHHGSAYGWYAFWQQLLWKENPDDKNCEQGIGIFTQYGWAPKDRYEIENHVGGGLRWIGAIPERDDDILGLGAFTVFFSDEAGHKKHAETSVELYYKAQVAGWMAIQPDIQYIINPGGTGSRNALAIGGRLEFDF